MSSVELSKKEVYSERFYKEVPYNTYLSRKTPVLPIN